MKSFIRSLTAGVFFLFLGISTVIGQEVTFSAGPAATPVVGAANGGFAWGDVNGDGNLDIFIPSNNIMLSSITSFAPAASTMTANIPLNTNSVGALMADFNGDGVVDLWTTNGGNPQSGLFYNTAGVFTAASGTGQLSAAPGNGMVFEGLAVGPIDQSNYLSAVWAGPDAVTGSYPGDGANFAPGSGIVLMKGGATGFTKVGIQRGTAPAIAPITQNFDTNAVGYAFAHIGWNASDIRSVDTLGFGSDTTHVLKNAIHNYNAAPVLKFVLPAGRTLSDYNSFTFKSYWAQGDVGYKDIVVEAYQTMPTGQAFNNSANQIGKWNRAQMGSTAWENTVVDITNSRSFHDTIYVAFGINCAGKGTVNATPADSTTIWYADSVTLGAKAPVVTSVTVAIDTSLAFESWDPRFFDANNDGYQDLFMPSFRHGFSTIDTGSSGARKGCVLFLNDGTGKFIVPTATTLGRTIYSVGASGASTTADTGIVVDDTVRHFSAIGCQFGDLNNDGKEDLILNGLGASDNRDGSGKYVADVILYGKGDGTFTYKWDGVHVVANNGITQATNQRAISIGDYNNDQLPDIYTSATYGPQHLYRNNGNGTFIEVTSQDNITAGGQRAGQFVDYNNDGFPDIYEYSGGSSILQMNGGNSNHWVGFTPVGTGHNMSAIGARFTVYTGATKQIRDIRAEGGAAGMGGTLRANFGLGINKSIDSVVVRWPDGTRHTYTGLAVDRYWTIKEGQVMPNMTALVYPANAAVSVAKADTLRWNKAASALGYGIQVSMDPTFANKAMMPVNATVTDTSYAFSLGSATKYYWRVAAVNGGFMSDYTPANNFTTTGSAAATVPTVVSPTSGAKDQASALTLKVGKTADASRYQWQVSIVSDFMTFVVNDSTADTTYAAKLTGGMTYYLRVRGMNDLGATAYSAVDTFSTMAVPARPTLLLPASSAQDVKTDSVMFTWSKVSNASSYNLKVMTVSSTNQYSTTDTVYKVKGLARLTNYTWQVQANNIGGSSGYTSTFAFTTVPAAPTAPAPASPAASAQGIPRKATFVWSSAASATQYHLQVATTSDFSSGIVVDVTTRDTIVTISDTLLASTIYNYRVSAINSGGEGAFSAATTFKTGTGVTGVQQTGAVPKEFALYQNYPNPFNPSTTIRYDIAKLSHVKVIIYDVLGRVVATLVDGIQAPSTYNVRWDAQKYASGVYFCRIEARVQDGSRTFISLKKLLFMK